MYGSIPVLEHSLLPNGWDKVLEDLPVLWVSGLIRAHGRAARVELSEADGEHRSTTTRSSRSVLEAAGLALRWLSR